MIDPSTNDGCSQSMRAWYRKHNRNTEIDAPDIRHMSQMQAPVVDKRWTTVANEIGSGLAAGMDPKESFRRHQKDLKATRHYIRWGRSAPEPELSLGQSQSSPQLSIPAGPTYAAPWGSQVAQDSPTHSRPFPKPTKNSQNLLITPGDLRGSPGFPGAPGASRGFPLSSGSQPLWSFERCPSLLPSHLDRDYGKQGRSVAGIPPASLPHPEHHQASRPQTLSPKASAAEDYQWQSSRGSSAASETPQRSKRESGRKSYRGLEGVVGTTWDGASTSAGGAYRGGDGRYLGF